MPEEGYLSHSPDLDPEPALKGGEWAVGTDIGAYQGSKEAPCDPQVVSLDDKERGLEGVRTEVLGGKSSPGPPPPGSPIIAPPNTDPS